MREDYAAQLQGAERELLQQNPSGLGRQEQAIQVWRLRRDGGIQLLDADL